MHSLTQPQVDWLKQRLEAQKTELQSALSRQLPRPDTAEDGRGLSTDEGDRAGNAEIVEISFSMATHLGHQLEQVERALHRLQLGSYGVCVDCIGTIGFARLIACPSAERCERCQEVYEHIHGEQLHPSL